MSLFTPLVSLLLSSLLLLSSSSLTSAQSTRPDFTLMSIASITSPQCTSTVSTPILNCTLPAELSVRITGLPLPTSLLWISFLFSTPSGDITWTEFSYLSTTDPSLVNVSLRLQGYHPSLFTAPLTVALQDAWTTNTSQPFNGVQLAYIPPPVFTSISGCQGSGKSTLNCLPDRDTLVLQGTGFLFFTDLWQYQLLIGNTTNWAGTGGGVRVVSDTVMTIYLNSSYSWILQPSHYSGVLMPLTFNLRVWSRAQLTYLDYFTAGSLAISFAPVPAPIYLSSYANGRPSGTSFCSRRVNSTADVFIEMIPETCWVVVQGHYLYYAQGYLTAPGKGKYACGSTIGLAYAGYLWCYVPLIPAGVDEPGLAWDLLVETASGDFTLKGAVVFTTSPVITSLVPCTIYSASWTTGYPGCRPGSTLVLRTSNFPANTPAVIQLSSNPYRLLTTPTVNVTCDQPLQLTDNSWSCVIPQMDATVGPAFWGLSSAISVSFPSTGQVTPSVPSYIVAPPDSPMITAVSGCEVSNGSLVVSRCRSGDVLTLTGSNLNASTLQVANRGPRGAEGWRCTLLPSTSTSTVQCRLPTFNEDDLDIVEDFLYEFSWYEYRALNAFTWSNPTLVAFTWDPLVSPPSGDSSSSSPMAILVGVLVPVGVISLLVVAWLLFRRLRLKQSSEATQASDEFSTRSGGFTNLEMR